MVETAAHLSDHVFPRLPVRLNEHVHFHVCAVDGVFEEVASERGDGTDAASRTPPPRTHRHRYFGVLASNSLLMSAVTALAKVAAAQPVPDFEVDQRVS